MRTTGNAVRVYYLCNSCNSAKCKKYRKSELGKQSLRKSVRKYNSTHKDKVRSWKIAAKHIPRGPCFICGNENADRHHEDSSKPLEVVMLCRLHHKQAHRKAPHTS